MSVRHLPLLVSALLLGAVEAQAQSALPEGLRQSGGVIMMQPIGDSDLPPEEPSNPSEHRSSTTHVLSAADHDLYAKAFAAADRGDWLTAGNLAAQGHDALAGKLLHWRVLLDKASGASFADIDAFVKSNPNWPGRDSLFARAEAALDPNMSPAAVIAWFGGREPASSIGKIRLGEAQIATGKLASGRDHLRDGWASGSFEPAQELSIVRKNGAYFTPDLDRQRLNNLLWLGDLGSARREMARVTNATQEIAAARIALKTGSKSAPRMIAELAADLGSDPDLLFDRARVARRAGDNASALALLQRLPLRETTRLHPKPLWLELSIAVRQALQNGDTATAYRLASETGFTAGDEFSDSQFLAGWIALRALKDPQKALTHFKRLAGGVSRSISLARAAYWAGRCYEEIGDTASAWAQYRVAAKQPETFYGQLALAHIEKAPVLHLRETVVPNMPARPAFESDELVRAMRILADLGQQASLRRFALHYQSLHPDAGYAKRLILALTEMGFRDVALRVAKTASYGDVVLPAYTYPVIAVPSFQGTGTAPEPALVLALIRQETEFDPEAVSSAGARGLMQIMPATVRRDAKLANQPVRPNDLTRDPAYNMQLGMAEFSGYLSDWGGSLILSAAAYNAGPNNAKRWVAAFGDPRDRNVDPVDWIEQIPFGETRNYVMRVIENIQVYRARLAGQGQPLRILADLYGTNPPPKVLIYTPPPPPEPAPKPKGRRS